MTATELLITPIDTMRGPVNAGHTRSLAWRLEQLDRLQALLEAAPPVTDWQWTLTLPVSLATGSRAGGPRAQARSLAVDSAAGGPGLLWGYCDW